MRPIALILAVLLTGCSATTSLATGALVVFGEGDRYTYGESGPTQVVGSPTWVLDAYGRPVEAAPLLTDGMGPDDLVRFVSIRSGALVLAAKACLLDDSLECSQPGIIVWPRCEFIGGMFAPFTYARQGDTNPVTVQEPYRQIKWSYTTRREGDQIVVSFDRARAWPDCEPPQSGTIDLRRHVVTQVKNMGPGGGSRLTHFSPGGRPFPVEANLPQPNDISLSPWTELPPGTVALGPPDFTLSEGWSVAKQKSSELQNFLTAHPGSVVANALNTSTTATLLGTMSVASPEWRIKVQSPDGQALTVIVQRMREFGGVGNDDRVTTFAAQRDASAPERFGEPIDSVSFSDFELTMKSLFGPAAYPSSFNLQAIPDDLDRVSYAYTYPVHTSSGDGWNFVDEYVDFDAASGRMQQAILSEVNAARILRPADHP